MKKFIIVIFVIICTIFLTGCSKDRVIKTFDDACKNFGDEILTKDNDLIGKRSFGIDHYTGTYVSSYCFNLSEIFRTRNLVVLPRQSVSP